jgi:hypothetical protein
MEGALAQHITRGPHSDSNALPETTSPTVTGVAARDEAGSPSPAFTEAGGATVAALLHLLRLLSAELVLLRGIDIAQFEQAVRVKIGDFTSPTPSREAREAGLAHARYLVDQILTQVRAQAELKKSLSTAAGAAAGTHGPQASGGAHGVPTKLLN